MTNLFHHHAENDSIRIENGVQVYIDRVGAFATDNGAAVPPLPPGAIERIYEPGNRHAISSGSSIIAAGAMPWAFGDTAIGNIASSLAAQATRTKPTLNSGRQPDAIRQPSNTTTVAS